MLRAVFLAGIGAATAIGAPPRPSGTPGSGGGTAGSSPAPDDDSPVCDQNPVLPYDKRLEIKDSALDGPPFDLAKYRGYAVWINIFATWCAPCREEQPIVVSTAAKYRAQGLRTIGLFANESDDAIRAYRAKFDITFPLVRDAEGYLTMNLQGSSTEMTFPSHLFIDGNGVLYCYEIGGLGTDTIENIVTNLLKTTESPLPVDPEPAPTSLVR